MAEVGEGVTVTTTSAVSKTRTSVSPFENAIRFSILTPEQVHQKMYPGGSFLDAMRKADEIKEKVDKAPVSVEDPMKDSVYFVTGPLNTHIKIGDGLGFDGDIRVQIATVDKDDKLVGKLNDLGGQEVKAGDRVVKVGPLGRTVVPLNFFVDFMKGAARVEPQEAKL